MIVPALWVLIMASAYMFSYHATAHHLFFYRIILEQIFLAPAKAYVLPAVEDYLADEQTPLLREQAEADEGSPSRPKTLQHRNTSGFDSSFSRVYFSNDSSTHFRKNRSTAAEDDEVATSEDVPGDELDAVTGVLWGKTAWQQIWTWWFWLPQLFLTCYMLRINYEIATVFDQVLYYTGELSLAEKVTDAFVLLLPLGGVVSIPFIGYVLDSLSSMAAFIVLLVLGLGYGALCMSTSVPAQLIGIVLFTIMRPLM
jgi:hypothetical protein